MIAHSRLPIRLKFIYGLGDWGTSAADTGRALFWLFFLVSVVGLDPGMAGSIVLIGRLWDAINDPLIGMLTDRTVSRWGRRRPYFLFGAIPFALGFLLLFTVPPFESRTAIFAYYLIVFLAFNTVYTLINVPYAALTAELTEDYDERSSLVGWRMTFSILASLITGATFKIVAENILAPRLGGIPYGIQAGYTAAAGLWAITMVIPPLLLFKNIEEPPRQPAALSWRPWETFWEVYTNRPFRMGATIYFLTFSTTEMVLGVFLWFLLYYLHVPPGFDSVILGVALVMALLTMPLVVQMMRHWGKRETYIVCMSSWILVLFLAMQITPGSYYLILLAAGVAGLGLGAAHVVPWAIVADVVEEDELRTGKRREGIYAGYLVFFRKLAGAVSLFIVARVLELTGFVPGTTGGAVFIEQPDDALLALRIFIGIVPAIMLLLAIWVAWRYPLNRQEHEALRQRLARRRAEAEKNV